MSLAALAFMLLVGGFIWGGFVFLLVRAVRCEAGKLDADGSDGAGG